MPGHGSFFYAALETVPHYQIITFAKFFYERHEIDQIITFVRVRHDDVFAFRRLEASLEGIPIALIIHVDDGRAVRLCDLNGAIRAAVVCHDDLPPDPVLSEKRSGLGDAIADGAFFVQAG